jgi:hypothetical protein
MYSLQDAVLAVRNPRFALTEVNRLYHSGFDRSGYNADGVDVFAEDWDVLVILDACRYDFFAEAVGNTGMGTQPLESRTSRGSATREWITGNFAGKRHHDLVYVDSNAHYGRMKDDIDAEVFKYTLVENDAFGGISVHPDPVTDAAIEAAERYPDKRLLVHYMQPHQPFFGPTAKDIEHHRKFPQTIMQNDLDRATVHQCYRENLEMALTSVERLLESVDGKVVVSADHGELLGDRQSPLPVTHYGHPAGLYVPELVKVPWLVHETESRRQVRESTPERDDIGLDNDEIDQKLRDLGYAV